MSRLRKYQDLDPDDVLSVAMESAWIACEGAPEGAIRMYREKVFSRKIYDLRNRDKGRRMARRCRNVGIPDEENLFDAEDRREISPLDYLCMMETFGPAIAALVDPESRPALPCVECGTIGGLVHKGMKLPKRSRGLCHNCYNRWRWHRRHGAFQEILMGTANFVSIDTATQGSWPNKYGADAALIYGGSTTAPTFGSAPAYASITYTHVPQCSVWANPTSDPRGLPTSSEAGAPSYAGLLWAAYSDAIGIRINITDGQTHKLAVYALDWNNYNYAATYAIVDHASGTVLDSRQLSNFYQGKWVVWAISGDVDLKVSQSGSTAAISAICFDPSAKVPTATMLVADVNPAVVGQKVTFTATVTPQTGSVSPTGTVTFYDNSTTPPTVLGSSTLS